jgi:hypothetical protein
MNEQLKTQVLEAKDALNLAITEARDAGLTVNLWIVGTGAAVIEPSRVDLDFGNSES